VGFGANPNWRVIEYGGEPMVLGFPHSTAWKASTKSIGSTASDGKIARIRCCASVQDTLRAIGERSVCRC
jgi:hypothetical protein